jgi:hypothetical protein
MADKDKEKAKVDLGILEEDDEFEEFPAEGEKHRKFDETATMTNKKLISNFRMGNKGWKWGRGAECLGG